MRRAWPDRIAWFFLLACTATVAAAAPNPDSSPRAQPAQTRWQQTEYGSMLERILPPSLTPEQLPQPASSGARLTLRYCVQCHNLPNPAMHARSKWPGIAARMVVRMQGKGNMGKLMKDLMAGVEVPSAEEVATITEYLGNNSQRAIEAARYPDLAGVEAQSFRLACSQCHTLPDPRRHRASEWPAIVARMERNMQWMNRVVGNRKDRTEPQLRVEEILAFLQKHSR